MNSKCDALMIQTYGHHFIAIGGCAMANWYGGFNGSMAQLTWVTEFSTPFVNFHQALTYHDLKDNPIYTINGICMTFAFFVFRVIWYYYVIFVKLIDFAMYRHTSFWATYEKN